MFLFPVVLQGSPSPQTFFWLRESFLIGPEAEVVNEYLSSWLLFSKPSALTGLCTGSFKDNLRKRLFSLDQGRGKRGFKWWLHQALHPLMMQTQEQEMLFKEVGGQANEDVRAP